VTWTQCWIRPKNRCAVHLNKHYFSYFCANTLCRLLLYIILRATQYIPKKMHFPIQFLFASFFCMLCHSCPTGFYQPTGQNTCSPCPPCSFRQITPCGGDSPGLCAAELEVSLRIWDTNITTLPSNFNVSGVREDVVIQQTKAPGLVISMLLSGADSLNKSFFSPNRSFYSSNITIQPEITISASLVPCLEPNTFRSPFTFQCHPCSNCSEFDVKVADCTPTLDTLCRGSIQLDYMIINPPDPSNLLPVQLDIQAIPCPPNQFRQRSNGVCALLHPVPLGNNPTRPVFPAGRHKMHQHTGRRARYVRRRLLEPANIDTIPLHLF